MKFKIDTNASYTCILPEVGPWSASMADEIAHTCQEVQETQPQNIIVDLSRIQEVVVAESTASFEPLIHLHETQYEADRSLIFTGITPALMASVKEVELHHILNITPTFQEAIDMINMENLERELFNEAP